MKIGVFVGSFDPVHNGHVAIMNYLVDRGIVDKVLVIPTGNYWEKQNLTQISKRIKMLELIKNDKIMIDKVHNDYQYTYQILEELEKNNKENIYYLVMGYDNYKNISLWKNYQNILNRGIIVINRDDLGRDDEKVIFVDKNFGDVSSTIIRKKIKDNKYHDISSFVDKKVLKYIKRNKLYR